MPYLDRMTKEYWAFARACSNLPRSASTQRACAPPLAEAAQSRLKLLAKRANKGQLTADEGNEYDGFVELRDMIVALRLEAECQMKVARE